jgi:alanine racemase
MSWTAPRPARVTSLAGANLVPVLNSLPQIEAWNAQARSGRLKAALQVDTGMNRLGLRPEEVWCWSAPWIA